MPKVKRYMWKGKVVTEKVYYQRLAQTNTGKRNLKTRVETTPDDCMENTSTAEKESTDIDEEQDLSNEPGEGRRIVDLKFLGEQLWCTSCKETLSLKNIEQEERRGLGSVLLIRCHKCLLVNPVVTGKQHTPPGKSRRNSRFDVNTKLAIGLIHSGIGFTNLNKLLACLNIPPINFKTYKRYEAEAGGALEIAAKESCQRTVELERQLTLENKATIKENM